MAYTTNSTIAQNNMTNNARGIWLISSTNSSILSNDIALSTWNPIRLDSSSSNTISGNNVTNNDEGIWVQTSPSNVISGNNITNSKGTGTGLYYSSGNSISGNDLTGNYGGIDLEYCSNSVISQNNVNCTLDGIRLGFSSGNSISGNEVTNNDRGINLENASGNIISGNNITTNNQNAVFAFDLYSSSSNNTIYHNSIGKGQYVFFEPAYMNAWDNGYPSGGNYWSAYNGKDVYSGLYQNQTGSDGIGDTPYLSVAGNTDHYPLIAPISVFDAGTWNGTPSTLEIVSNSTLSNMQIDTANNTVSFNVTGPESTYGFCRITIPNSIVQDLWHGNYTVLLSNEPWSFQNWTDATNTYIYINYTHSEHTVEILPEFPSIMALSLFTAVSTLAVAFAKRRVPRKRVMNGDIIEEKESPS